MSLTAQIGSSDVAFKLTQKVVASLAEKFSFKFEDGWNTISSRTVENIQKRIKRAKRLANPASSIKHPRTAFSFFTQKQRPVSQAAHPTASFGELSRFVSEAWKSLTPEQMADFKALETADKARYQVERTAVLAAAPAAEAVVAESSSESEAPAKKEKKVKAPKTPKAAEAAPVAAAPAPVAAEKKVKSAKAAKVAPATAAPATPAPAPVAEVKAAKAPKSAKKAEAAPATPAPVAVAEVKAAAPKAPKVKAVKA